MFLWKINVNINDSYVHRFERFVKAYKEPCRPTKSSVEIAVKQLMDDLLEGIVRNLPENPTIPGDRSGAETPSTL